ncbi:MAG: NUDIX domain-containing protein [Flavobacteriales bacterium]|jgi:ADP-ribose pyrophosphatase YjhB (NUDIX family)|nr:NUDIX domain-containing protein [Flavobacteriales bacterium]MBK6891873.1 NUDIX domain-containing protein [Flavobacteriales bacterium]MBK7248488.1 NUDIX domain-containing protein [Flavobacteriales bacterium]MBK7288135.1 NUDIX domain-containing protein [Flavobacteriales bacterium]MBK9059293.1 NUDIX domain-containing protein [Flavobacteriales bacterium]
MSISRFNIRVYGLLIHAGRLLVSDEVIQGVHVTKFPGGGLEPGEGTLDCLRREIQEEMGMEASGLNHFYTTDFFQPSAYRPEDQIVSIYYTFQVEDPGSLGNGERAMGAGADEAQQFRWIPLDMARIEHVDLPIDRVVMKLLINGENRLKAS